MKEQLTVFDWFSSLSGPMKNSLLRRIFAAFETIDPGAGDRREIWKDGNTAVVSVVVPEFSSKPVRIHLTVPDADIKLLRVCIRRAIDGSLAFEEGFVDVPSVGRFAALIASVGIGQMCIRERAGELMISATTDGAVALLPGLQIGGAFPGGVPPEGFVALLYGGQLFITCSFDEITEVKETGFHHAPVRVGLAPLSDGLMVLGFKILGLTDDWADVPFSIAIEPPDNRWLLPLGADGQRKLVLVLVARVSGAVHGIRKIAMPRSWSVAFDDLIATQAMQTYRDRDYTNDLAMSYQRGATPGGAVGWCVAMADAT